MHSKLGICRTLLAVGVAVSLVIPLWAQESENIIIANGIVARIRTADPYGSLKERAAAIHKAIAEVMSTQDTQNPQVAVKQVDGIWCVFVGPVKIIGLQPAEVEANNLEARSLAAIWAGNIKERLPLTTPVSRMPAGATLPPLALPAGRPSEPAPPEPAEPRPMSRSASLLLIVDAFNVIRSLPEDDYLVKRENVAGNLLKNLRPFMALPVPPETQPLTPAIPLPITGGPTVGPPVPPPSPIEVLAPLEAPIEPFALPPAEAPVEAPAPTIPEFIPVPGIGLTAGIPAGHEDDPAYAKVPQKQRVRAKFKLAADPYSQLTAEDPESAKAVGELLKAARTAFTAEDFDVCERHLDNALRMLGAVPLQPVAE